MDMIGVYAQAHHSCYLRCCLILTTLRYEWVCGDARSTGSLRISVMGLTDPLPANEQAVDIEWPRSAAKWAGFALLGFEYIRERVARGRERK